MCECDDLDLVARLRCGEEAAFVALVARHDAALRRAALMFVSSQALADEVVQDTWLAVVYGVNSFDGRCSLRTWIFQILINRARTRGAREARSVPLSAVVGADGRAAMGSAVRDQVETPRQRLLRKELGGVLAAAILGLPERQRMIVILRDALGWSSGDVCHLLDLTRLNQRVILHRARSRLRASLEDYRARG